MLRIQITMAFLMNGKKKNGLDLKVDNSGKKNLNPAYDDIEVYLNSLVEHIIK